MVLGLSAVPEARLLLFCYSFVWRARLGGFVFRVFLRRIRWRGFSVDRIFAIARVFGVLGFGLRPGGALVPVCLVFAGCVQVFVGEGSGASARGSR